MGTHWFDRLARTRAAASQPVVGGSEELTRRDALARAGAATLSLGAIGALGAFPAAAAATPRTGTRARDNTRLVECRRCRQESHERAIKSLDHIGFEFAKSVFTPAVGVTMLIYIAQLVGTELGHYSSLQDCVKGVCNPQSYKPAPSATPATEVETGAPICPPGTRDCGEAPGTGNHYCCFGTDMCCNGTCCIADVGCACAPG
ncbi:MAG TPA: hypothetical protein VMF55_12405 [Solirubrobacterales bacterium]|nr:hypothetical protein [Solirubrobacterales bacterium]